MKKITFLLSFFLPIILFAQDSTSVGSGVTSLILPTWVTTIAIPIVLGVYELLVRLVPTTKNWSILGWVIKLLQTVIPNNNSKTPTQPHA